MAADQADIKLEDAMSAFAKAAAQVAEAMKADAADDEPTNLKDASKKARETFRNARVDAEDAKDGGKDESKESS